MIEPVSVDFLQRVLGVFGNKTDPYDPAALTEYERCFRDPDTIHALCEDYRAAASIDLEHDAEDRERRVECPLYVLWGAHSVVGQLYDPLAVWEDYAADVRGQAVDGHFLVEERPNETLRALEEFLHAAG